MEMLVREKPLTDKEMRQEKLLQHGNRAVELPTQLQL